MATRPKTKSRTPVVDQFFDARGIQDPKLTYDDVRLQTDYSDVMPSTVKLNTRFTRNITLRIPIVSAAMDTVTESAMAIALASAGGIGVIHKNMTPKRQAEEVQRVKLHLNGLIESPICVRYDQTVAEVLAMRKEKDFTFHSFPVIEEHNALIGLLTKNDFDLVTDYSMLVRDAMTSIKDLVTAKTGTSIDEAFDIMRRKKKKLLPLVDARTHIAGLYVLSDLKRIRSGQSMHNVDSNGHLRVAAAVGVGDGALERAALLARKGCDAFVIDTAHGDSKNVFDTIKRLRKAYPSIDIAVGNVSRDASAKRLTDAGADGVIVGQGGGSICTTRIVAGIGCPQVSAVYSCVKALRGTGIPVVADGGIRNSGDIAIALAIGAECVVLGRGLATAKEAPGEVRTIGGVRMKAYRGMASEAALQQNAGSRERYRQTGGRKLVPEGVESWVPAGESAQDILDNFTGGVQNSFGYLGASTMDEFAKKAEIFCISAAGLQESHPHDVLIAREAPNYRRS